MSVPALTVAFLAVVAGMTVGSRDKVAGVVIAALAANWLVCYVLSSLYGDVTNWLSLAAIDFVTVLLLMLWYEARDLTLRWPLFVMGIYAGQLLCHASYAVVSFFDIGTHRAANYYYFWTLTWAVWGQIAIVGGGVCGGLVGRIRMRGAVVERVSYPDVLRRSGSDQ